MVFEYRVEYGGLRVIMAVSYKKLFKLMIDQDVKKKELHEKTGLSYSTLLKLENGQNVQVSVLERICTVMNCSFDDIVEIVPESNRIHRI